MLYEMRKDQEAMLAGNPKVPVSDMLFADFMEVWLEVVKPELKLTTYGGYQLNVKSAIAPYFREKGILLRDLTADDFEDFSQRSLNDLMVFAELDTTTFAIVALLCY